MTKMAYFIKELNSGYISTMFKSVNFNGVSLFYRGEDGSVWQTFLGINL